jgi:DNA helicase II / ATP-dependent DNA helicase PcrA
MLPYNKVTMGSYIEALHGLNEAQRLAVTTIEGPVLVIAGPGTGKTQLLTTRIAHILATTDTLPQNILCLTFTESAALNMRERLASMIGQGAYDVTMSTYHAFGSDLIRRFPDYFTDDAELQPADDLTIDRTFRAIVASLPYGNPLKYADNYLTDIKTLVSDAKRALLTPEDLRNVAKENLLFIHQVTPLVQESLRNIARIDKKSIPLFRSLLDTMRQRPQPANSRVESIEQLFKKELEQAVIAAEETGKTTTLTAWKNRWLAKDTEGRFIADGEKSNKKLAAAADVYDAYLQALKKQGLFDYDDMILRAVHTLETNADLRFTLQEQYLYMLLDEFQDTNGAQLRLVELLTDNPVHERRPNILAVGDDDQAIYAFQGANYSHMLQFKEMYRDVLPVPLTQNYRSHRDILHTASGIAEQIEERLHHHFPAIEKTLTAENKKLPETATVERREAQSDVMQYAWVTKRIAELRAQGVPARSIAILAPQHKYLEPLVPFLQNDGIPVRYDKRENVLDDPAIHQLLRMSELCLALARGDHAPANALWSQVLSFDFWKLPTSTLWRLSWQTHDEHRSWTDELLDDEYLKPIALFFIRLSHIVSTETLETMMDYLIGGQSLDLQEPGYTAFRSPYYEHYFGDMTYTAPSDKAEQNADFWNVLTNLIVLRSKLREYHKDGDERLTLADFITFIEAHRAADLKIVNTSPYASSTDAVELMTAFKAKGMEWDVVFVLAVNDDAWGGTSHSASTRISLPANVQYIRYAGATQDERLRLFYVAITRAKTHLYLMNYVSNYAGKTMTRLKYLNEPMDDAGVIHSPLMPAGKQLVLNAEDGVAEPSTELAAYWQRRHEQALSNADMRALLQDRLKQFQLSPTHVCDFVDIVHCGPQAFFLKTILRFPQAYRPEAQFGQAMHETLEWIHQVTKRQATIPSVAEVLGTFARHLADNQPTEHDASLFLERGSTALRAYLEQRPSTITTDAVVEYSFRGEGVFVGDAHMAGKIDKLIIDRQQKNVCIVDYKTGRAHTKWARDIKLHKYQHQLYLYRALVEGSHTYGSYQVADEYLEFVEPDEDGNIRELHLPFDEATFSRSKQLAHIIWQRLMNVDLPDTSTYTADLAGIEAFERDLLS